MRRNDPRGYLFDVSRLIWRSWRGRPATGIDRVCTAYLDHFGPRSQAVIRRRGRTFVLSEKQSDRLMRLLVASSRVSRARLLGRLVIALATAGRSAPRAGMIYLNVGHTGLDDPALPEWVAKSRIRAIYLIHDLIPVTHPRYCRPGEAARHERRMENVLASASGVIGNSRDTLSELARFAVSRSRKMPPHVTAWLGIEGHGAKVAAPNGRPYFVTVGTIEARKNHILLLRAWEELVTYMGSDAPELIIIGGRGWEAAEAIDSLDHLGGLRGHVREINGCDDAALASWIAGARALLMPSFAEGFGLPVLEALSRGTPVIASDLAVFRELAGDIPRYLDPAQPRAWAAAVQDFVGNSDERHRQIAAMTSYRAPRWKDHFDIVENWLADLQVASRPQ